MFSNHEVRAVCANAEHAVVASLDYDVPVERLLCVAHRETKWNPLLVGSSGECGITQVLPSKKATCANLREIPFALKTTARLLSRGNLWYRLSRRVCGSNAKCITKHTLMGYNAGTAAALGRGHKLARAEKYANAVLRCEEQYERSAVP